MTDRTNHAAPQSEHRTGAVRTSLRIARRSARGLVFVVAVSAIYGFGVSAIVGGGLALVLEMLGVKLTGPQWSAFGAVFVGVALAYAIRMVRKGVPPAVLGD